MNRYRSLIILVIAFLLVGALFTGWSVYQNTRPAPLPTPIPSPTALPFAVINGVGGSEKGDLMQNPEVVRILRDKYGLEVHFSKMGSLEQVRLSTALLQEQAINFLWPSNSSAVVVFEQNHTLGDFPQYKSENILRSPIVVYSWRQPTEALIKEKVVVVVDNVEYLLYMKKLLEMTKSGVRWEDIQTERITGPITIQSSDPNHSNSANMMYLLIANLLAGGDVASVDTVKPVLQDIRKIYDAQGLQLSSSAYAFDAFITEGVGRYKLMVGYESQILEFSRLNPQAMERYKSEIRIIYPDPTVWSDHPILALDGNGRRFMEAMKDADIQKIAWEMHGFRSGLPGITNDVAIFDKVAIPQTIFNALPLPAPEVIEMVNGCLLDANQCQ